MKDWKTILSGLVACAVSIGSVIIILKTIIQPIVPLLPPNLAHQRYCVQLSGKLAWTANYYVPEAVWNYYLDCINEDNHN